MQYFFGDLDTESGNIYADKIIKHNADGEHLLLDDGNTVLLTDYYVDYYKSVLLSDSGYLNLDSIVGTDGLRTDTSSKINYNIIYVTSTVSSPTKLFLSASIFKPNKKYEIYIYQTTNTCTFSFPEGYYNITEIKLDANDTNRVSYKMNVMVMDGKIFGDIENLIHIV